VAMGAMFIMAISRSCMPERTPGFLAAIGLNGVGIAMIRAMVPVIPEMPKGSSPRDDYVRCRD
jgi:hypothetical protein